jgi:hypothetical protein
LKGPQPPESWRGARDATVEGSDCPQQDMTSGTFMGDENCLFLNVFTNKVTQLHCDFVYRLSEKEQLRLSSQVFKKMIKNCDRSF